MRRSKPVRIGELWQGFVSDNPKVAIGLCEAQVPEIWAKVVGPAVNSLTRSVEVNNGILTAQMSSSVARQEMFMQRQQLKEKINKEIGGALIREVIVK